MAARSAWSGLVLVDNVSGKPLSNGKINFWTNGTTNAQDTFPTVGLSPTANANPLILDADGRVPEAWSNDTDVYAVRILDENDNVILSTVQDISFIAPFTLSSADVLAALAANSAAVDIAGSSMVGSAFSAFADNLDLTVAGSIDASAGAITLGTVTGATTFSGLVTHGADVVSDTDSTDSLGTTGIRWAKLWVDDITMGGTLAAAAITCSTIVTSDDVDVTGIVSISSNLRIGATPATSGEIRMSNNTSIRSRNNVNSANITMISVNTSDEISIDVGGNGSVFGGDLTLSAGDVIAQNGSAAAPSHAFGSALTTGMYLGAEAALSESNTVAFSIVGSTVSSAFGRWDSNDTDIDGIIAGSSSGVLLLGPEGAHVSVALRENDGNDGFQVISGGGNWGADEVWDTLCFEVRANGDASIASDLTLGAGSVKVTESTAAQAPADLTQSTATSTNFHRLIELNNLTIWISDGTTAEGALTGVEGDICLNGGVANGQAAFCDAAGTNWTDM